MMKVTPKKMEGNLTDYFNAIFEESNEATGLNLDQDQFCEWFRDINDHPCLGIVDRSGHGDWCFGFDDKCKLKLGDVRWGYGIGSFHKTDIPNRLMMDQDRFLRDIKHSVEDTFSTLKEIEIEVGEFKVPKISVKVIEKS